MKQIKIENFRSFKTTEYIDVKPISILIGKNSSGKSSFLRTFPLLKQSYSVKTKSPILLYTENYIDFGENHDIKPHFANENDYYKLGFKINSKEILNTRFSRQKYVRYNHYKKDDFNDSGFDIEYLITFNEDKDGLLHISNIFIQFLSNNISIDLNYDKKLINNISINSKLIFDESDNIKFSEHGEFQLDFFKEKPQKIIISNETHNITRREPIEGIILDLILKFITGYVRKGTHEETKLDIISSIYLDNDEEMLSILKDVTYPQTWGQKIAHWTVKNQDFRKLRNYLILHNLFESLLGSMNSYLKQTFLSIKYIAPLRATAERYYRIQHLAIEEVDPNGKNLPMFLDSLSRAQMNEYKKWTKENFNFEVRIHKQEGHYSIKIILDGENEMNLSDVGFGYSQILPILTQIWYSINEGVVRSRLRSALKLVPKIIAIEQPELHLHPDFQAKFADSIAKIIHFSHKMDIDLRLIIETHSDIIVNRLGDCIIDKVLQPEDVNIVIFNKEDNNPTTVETSSYDKFGNLLNWPIGFFQPSYI